MAICGDEFAMCLVVITVDLIGCPFLYLVVAPDAMPRISQPGIATMGLFGRAPALPKIAPALAPQMERLLWWSWSRFRKCLPKQLHLLD